MKNEKSDIGDWRVIDTGHDTIYIHEIYRCMVIRTSHYFGGNYLEEVWISLTRRNHVGETVGIFASYDEKAGAWADRITDELLDNMTDEIDYLPEWVKPFFED